MEESELNEWRCPACNTNTNSLGRAFTGSRATALHVAGKIKTGDHAHRQWAIKTVGDTIYDPGTCKTINTLADVIELDVMKINQARIRQEEERIQRIIEQRDANKEPKVLAYRYIQYIETSLHQCIRETLQGAYGGDEDEWWVKGVPTNIRVQCANRREESTQREELYSYTDLIHLKVIIEKNRKLFEPRLLSVSKHTNQQKEFLDNIARSNDIRIRVMHTIRSLISSEEISFLKQFNDLVKVFVQ
jgi:hypothetical protein